MRSDIEDAILGMYDSIERAREAQAAAGHLDQGARQGITSGKHLGVKGQNVCLARRVAGVRFGLFECRLSGCSRCR